MYGTHAESVLKQKKSATQLFRTKRFLLKKFPDPQCWESKLLNNEPRNSLMAVESEIK